VIKSKQKISAFIILILSSLLSGCQAVLLNPKGTIAMQEKHILLTSVLLMLIVVLPVIFLVVFIAWRYRASNTKATYSPDWSHSTLLEIIWWSIPCIIIGILSAITWYSSHHLDPYRPLTGQTQKPIIIQAISLQWKWLFIYPEQGFATLNYIQFPAGVPVDFYISAEGPMNSLQIPQLGGQIYAMAGMRTQLHLIANEPGDYRGVSANFTGEYFADMKFSAHVGTQAEFDAWVKEAKSSKEKLTWDAYQQLVAPKPDATTHYYTLADKTLFEDVIMKAMMPMPNGTMPMKSMNSTNGSSR
jgi:cytochrome o ubiquinol oxidase subunit 2